MTRAKSASGYSLRSRARLRDVTDNIDLPDNSLSFFDEQLMDERETETMAATKDDIAELLRNQKARKAFSPQCFSGKSYENAKEFLASFDNYAKLNKIPEEEKILTFEMCLAGAAKIWFLTLSEEVKKNFTTISEQFKLDYVQNNQWLNTTRLENRKLRSGETAEHYVADMSNLALLTGIKDEELAKALIRGLPDQLRWHVISFNPTSLSDTIQRILLGEATLAFTGKEEIHAISENNAVVVMKKMEERMDRLEDMLKTCQISRADEFMIRRSRSLPRHYEAVCDVCGKSGHKTTNCFMNEQFDRPVDTRSQRPVYQQRSYGNSYFRNGNRNNNPYYNGNNTRPSRVRFDTRDDNAYNQRQYRSYNNGYNFPKNTSTPRI